MGLALPDLDEAGRRSSVAWVALDDGAARLVWCLWHDGALWLVIGGMEQSLPGAQTAGRALVTLPGKAARNDQVVSWTADVSVVAPGSAEGEAVVPLLHERRLNPPDGEEQPERWARESLLVRLAPTADMHPESRG